MTFRQSLPFAALFLLFVMPLRAQNGKTMMQGFYWDVSPGAVWYDSLAYYAPLMKRVGFDAIWFPPPSKGAAGSFDVGYTPYDYYDLGEFDSAPGDFTSGFGNYIPTRYGTRAGLEAAITAYKSRGIEVYVDVVLNHRSGGKLESNPFGEFYTNRSGGSLYSPGGDSTFTAFPLTKGSGRIAWPEGSGADYFFPNGVRNPSNTGDFFADTQIGGFHQLYVNSFGYDVALHNGDGSNLPMGDSLMIWGQWLIDEIGFDGFRFDFVKGVHPEYFKRFVDAGSVRGKYTVHELYDGSMDRLKTYLNQVDGTEKPGAIFDFNMRFAYKEMSDGGNAYDIRNWHSRGLFTQNGVDWNRVNTFVENHDFDRNNFLDVAEQEGHAPVVNNKHLAYAHLLTHPGMATVWWRDYFRYGFRDRITRLMQVRNEFVGGGLRVLTARGDTFWPGNSTEDPKQVYVAQRLGTNDTGAGNTGLIVAINKHSTFPIEVWVTSQLWANQRLVDITGNRRDTLQVFADGRVLIKTLPSEYHIFVPVGYALTDVMNVAVTEITSPGTEYLVGDSEAPRIRVTNLSDFSSQNILTRFTLRDSLQTVVYRDSVLIARLEAGETAAVAFAPYVFGSVGRFEAVAELSYALDQDAADNRLSRMIAVADTTTAYPFRVDGNRSESRYRTLALKQNTNAGFGLGKDVKGIYLADAADSLYFFVEGRVPLTDADGIGLMLDFSQRDGLPAGTAITQVPGSAFFLNSSDPDHRSYAFDFEVDYGLALLGVQSGNAGVALADFTGPAPSGRLQPLGGDTVRYAFRKTGGLREGWEIAIPRSAIGVTGGEVRGFAFIISSTAYFSNVMVPGDSVGMADAFGNHGFNVNFNTFATGGPYHSAFIPVNSTEAVPVPTQVELHAPADNAQNVVRRPTFSWHPADRAEWYTLTVQDDVACVQPGCESDVRTFGPIADTTFTLPADLNATIGRFAWFVTAENSTGAGPVSQTRTFTVAEIPPAPTAAPVLLSPENEQRLAGIEATTSWSSVENADRYDIQTSISSLFFSNFYRSTLADTTWTGSPFAENRRYYWRVRAGNAGGWGPWTAPRSFITGTVVSIDDGSRQLPTELTLHQNHPNPFNPTTVISFGVPQAGMIRIVVYDILGREVAKVVDGSMNAGWHQVPFHAGTLASGMYLYQITYQQQAIIKRMMLVK